MWEVTSEFDLPYLKDEIDVDWIWENVVPDYSPIQEKDSSSWVLIFQCLHCEEYLVIIDMD